MKFVGNYPEQVRSVLTASALAGVHAIILGPPGWGKTSLALACARALGGLGGYVVIRLDPATPPARIQGAYDPAAILQGRLERVLEGTHMPRASRSWSWTRFSGRTRLCLTPC